MKNFFKNLRKDTAKTVNYEKEKIILTNKENKAYIQKQFNDDIYYDHDGK